MVPLEGAMVKVVWDQHAIVESESTGKSVRGHRPLVSSKRAGQST